ncbi:Chorismate synthase [Streptomyces glaucescens]
MVCCAGGTVDAGDGHLKSIAAEWHDTYRANVLTAVLTVEALVPLLADTAGIVLYSSIAAYRGSAGTGGYGAAKAALHAYTHHLATRLGPRGISVNAIAPGYVAGTEFFGDRMTPAREALLIRQTAMGRAWTPLGAVARSYLKETAGIEIVSHVVELAAAKAPYGVYPTPADVERLDADPVRCLDADASKAMVAEIDQAHRDGDTLGGVVEVLAYGVPVGLGSHVHWDRRLDARLAAALMGIQAIKGVEVGDGFGLARVPGSRAHDEIVGTEDGIKRVTGRSGGTEGGLTTGELLRVRAAMKPIATVPRALRTVDVATGEPAAAHHQRSDVCAVPAAGIVAEAMVALVLADAVAEKFGGDSVTETRRNVRSYLDTLHLR